MYFPAKCAVDSCLSQHWMTPRLQDSLEFIELRAEVQRDMTAKFATAVCATKDIVCDQALKEKNWDVRGKWWGHYHTDRRATWLQKKRQGYQRCVHRKQDLQSTPGRARNKGGRCNYSET